MAGTFKFQEFLSEEEREAFNRLREKLGGKTVYIPYPERDHFHEYLQRRNEKMRRMYWKYKELGLPNILIYAEIAIRLTCAKGLSVSRIRAIVHEYGKEKNK